ncbi:unnamed protein product, partial [Didymodactylos carnosus]
VAIATPRYYGAPPMCLCFFLMFSVNQSSKTDFLQNLNEARDARRREKDLQHATVLIQANIRGYLARKKFNDQIRNELINAFQEYNDPKKKYTMQLASKMFSHTRHFLTYYQRGKAKQRSGDLNYLLLNVFTYIINSLQADEIKYSYLAAFFNKDLNSRWMSLNHEYSLLALKILETNEVLLLLFLLTSQDIQLSMNALQFLVVMTDYECWKSIQKNISDILKTTMEALNRTYLIYFAQHNLLFILKTFMNRCIQRRLEISSIDHVATLTFKLLLCTDFNGSYLILISSTILTIPAFLTLCTEKSHKFFAAACQKDLFNRLICVYSTKESFMSISDRLDVVEICYLLGNIVSLAAIDIHQIETMKQPFINILFNILEIFRQRQSGENSETTKSNTTLWHPIIGHVKGKTVFAVSNNDLNHRVIQQLKFLWSKQFVNILFESSTPAANVKSNQPTKETNIIRAKFEKLFSKSTESKLSSDETQFICRIATLYQNLIHSLTELRLQILCALSLQEGLISSLWLFLQSIGPNCGIKELTKLYETTKGNNSLFELLQLFCNLCSYLVTVLDEEEMYRQQKHLELESWTILAYFLNNILYRIIRFEYNLSINTAVCSKNFCTSPTTSLSSLNLIVNSIYLERKQIFKTLHPLLVLLYERNTRKSFVPDNFWLIRDCKPSVFIADIERDDPCAKFLLEHMPHILPFKDRVKILQKYIETDKHEHGIRESSMHRHIKNHIEVRRNNLFGDSYEALRSIVPVVWKNTLRVTFINSQGLPEPGIDQNGIFKEFIQEITKQSFDPAFNLFKTTENGSLYPSPLSVLNENYLSLFSFVGKILGKAVYEQIVLDVEFAPFFLRNLIGHRKNINYSCLDDLMFLDRDLYNNLTFVKHYDGDVSSLELTYSIDEDILGQMVTQDIIPCGRHITVTNDDKIIYVHRMALYRTYTRIKQQIKMFSDGFKSLIKPEWLNMFSVPELQQLISGETQDINIQDLKSNTVYQGGYHKNHSVIKWLWDLVEKEFTREERALFLRFVTSCSRPPLLGFSQLNPPFTIRCLESSEEQDEGDSLGRIFRNMINIGRTSSERLPSSSTCFNLLKLPNYKTRNILREKLRYAINSNAGFELS